MASELPIVSSNTQGSFKQVNCCRAVKLITSLVIAMIGVALIVTIKKEYRSIVSLSCTFFIIGINGAGHFYIRSLKNAKPEDIKPSQAPIENTTKVEKGESFSYNNSEGPTLREACPPDGVPVAAVLSLEEMLAPLPVDLKEFYQFLTKSERKAIQECYDHPLQEEIIPYIQKGEWAQLVLCYQTFDNPDLFYNILNAIFLQGKLDQVDDLVTADMAISNSRVSLNADCKMVTYEEARRSYEWSDFGKFSNIEGVPENQLYFFEMNLNQMTDDQKGLVNALFDRGKTCVGALQENGRYLFASAALKRRDSRLIGSVRYIYKLPRRSKVCKYILRKENVFSLLYPKDEERFIIHGTYLIGLLGHAHDGYHANERGQEKLFERIDLLNLGVQMEDVLKTLPPYSNGAVITRGKPYRKLNTINANQLDKVRFFLEEISQHIIDAENLATFKKNPTICDHLRSIIFAVMDNNYGLVTFIRTTLSTYLEKVGYEIISVGHFTVRPFTIPNQSLMEQTE